MSPSATSASTIVVDRRGIGVSMNGQAKSYGHGAGSGGAKRPLAHIDDITSVTVDIDPHAPLDRIIQHGEAYFRQAESSRSFGRHDLALKDYIRASTIVVDVIKKNKGWASMRDNKSLHDRYQRLVRQITAAHEEYEEIKADIKADNARTGVQRTVARPAPPSQAPPPIPRGKPTVQPKPQGLHGNTLNPSMNGAVPNKAVADLAQRFANLRQTTAAPVQDPRIRTKPIIPPPRPAQVSAASVSHRAQPISLNTSLPDLPKLPDAIYSPARGTLSNETAQLPSSTQRAMFSRTGSTTTLQQVVNRSSGRKSPPSWDYSVSGSTYTSSRSSSPVPKRPKLALPSGDTLTAEALVQYMQAGSRSLSILIVDIRSRQEYEEGHIMSQATICVESDILMREHISASEIADSLVLAPTSEQLLFEKRHDFDMIVFYDTESLAINPNPHGKEEQVVLAFYNALTQFDFGGHGASKTPKLLTGGIEAWINLMGSVSLQTSGGQSGRPAVRPIRRQTQRFVTRPIQDPEEARRWEETLSDLQSFSPIKTTEDFLRRFPPVSSMQESMTTPTKSNASMASGFSYQNIYSALPTPPARPAPAVPRPSYSGLADTGDNESLPMKLGSVTPAPGTGTRKRKRTGLHNPNNWCYANSSLQVLFATRGLTTDLSQGSWSQKYQVPKKADEMIRQPQLLSKFLANLFHWMEAGDFHTMQAKSLMEYIAHVSGTDSEGKAVEHSNVFGGDSQQDAQEFLNLLTQNLHDETNTRRDKGWDGVQRWEMDKRSNLELAMEFWTGYQVANDSLIDKYFRGVDIDILTCRCGAIVRQCSYRDFWTVTVKGNNLTVDKALTRMQEPESVDPICDYCKKQGERTRTSQIARLPDRLIIQLGRFELRYNGTIGKSRNKVEFPIQGLDMTPYAIPPSDATVQPGSPHEDLAKTHHFKGPFLYDLYGYVVHQGNTPQSGHYWAFVRDQNSKDPDDWWRIEDTIATPMTEAEVKARQEGDPYLLFYQRRGV